MEIKILPFLPFQLWEEGFDFPVSTSSPIKKLRAIKENRILKIPVFTEQPGC